MRQPEIGVLNWRGDAVALRLPHAYRLRSVRDLRADQPLKPMISPDALSERRRQIEALPALFLNAGVAVWRQQISGRVLIVAELMHGEGGLRLQLERGPNAVTELPLRAPRSGEAR